MASACVNNLGMSPDAFLDCPPSCGWLTAPLLSFTRDDNPNISFPPLPHPPPPPAPAPVVEVSVDSVADIPDPVELPALDAGDFEFQPHDPVAMLLPADELFSDGKLVPLRCQSVAPAVVTAVVQSEEIRSPDSAKPRRLREVLSASRSATTSEAYLFSPKAPSCSSRWRELLGLKKSFRGNHKSENTTSSASGGGPTTGKSIRLFLHRREPVKPPVGEGCLSLPLLRDSDCESASASSSHASRSSSSSGHDVDDLRRLSVDTDKPGFSLRRSSSGPSPNPPKVRLVKPRPTVANHPTTSTSSSACRVGRSLQEAAAWSGGSVDSPRMNSSGKVVFQGLERSSSSPSSLNGGVARYSKYRGMERSYSANVRITPFLNVPVCSLRGSSKSGGVFGFGQLFSSTSSLSSTQSQPSQKKDGGGNGKAGQHHSNHQQTTVTTNGKGRRESTTT